MYFNRPHYGVLMVALALVTIFTIVINLTVSSRIALLFLTGTLLGLSLYQASFGFTYSFRMLLTNKRSVGVRAQLIMLALTSMLFFPILATGTLFGRPVFGNVAPADFSVIIGAFLFGIGMQLGGGCASGTLFSVGGGNIRMFVTLAFFIVGSLIGTTHLNFWHSSLPSPSALSMINLFGPHKALVINLVIFAIIWVVVAKIERDQHGALESTFQFDDENPKSRFTLLGPWPLIFGAIALSILNFLTLYLSGRPWGVSSAFALWGAKILQVAGVDVYQWTSWSTPSQQQALASSVLSDVTSVMNFGIILGAMLAAGLANRLQMPSWRVPRLHLIASIIGGILLGYGARLAYGCNIGAFFSGVASGSLHGWLWIVCCLTGNWIGLRIQPLFDLPEANGFQSEEEKWVIFKERLIRGIRDFQATRGTKKVVFVCLIITIFISLTYLILRYNDSNLQTQTKIKTQGNFDRVASGTGIPIRIGDTMIHSNYGHDCLKCHYIAGGDTFPKIRARPIAPDAKLRHPFRGVCNKCHTSTQAGAATVAYVNSIVGQNVWGADCLTITPGIAEQYNLPTNSGVLVNDVEKNSFAEKVGLIEGDIIQEINNQTINKVTDMLLVLADKHVGDGIKIKVLSLTSIKNKRNNKNLKFAITNFAINNIGVMDQRSKYTKLGIMSMRPDLNSKVAYNFANASYLIVYDTTNNDFFALKNPYRGMTNHEVSNWVVSQKVGHVIVGNINQLDILNLQQADIKVFSEVFGQASDAITLYQNGSLIVKSNSAANKATATLAANKINVLAIPVNNPLLSENISKSVESANYFIKVELDRNKYTIITNPLTIQSNGVMLAQFLVDNEIDAVIINQISSATVIELKKFKVAIYTNVTNVDMSAEDAIQKFLNNKLNSL
ncbi:MAG: YeeE/YedE family protein [Oligoflexia bacterium]|nr:YeeE/YedE family protein [Oligoflexia bacterium]